MQRRNILTSTALVSTAAVLGLSLAACQTNQTPQAQVQTNAALLTAGVAAVAASVLATPNLAPDTADKVKQALATVNAANDVIQRAAQPMGTAAQQLALAVKLAAPVLLATLNASSPEAIAINAALALLPTILAAAGVPPLPATAMAPGRQMAPAQAVLILRGYTGK